MTNYLSALYTHIVFSTKGRENLINPAIEKRLYAYIIGICRKINCRVLAIGGTGNHIHLLIRLPVNQPLSDCMRTIKANSSRWVNKEHLTGEKFYWQKGYAAFSVSHFNLDRVVKYILNQKIHHQKIEYEQELIYLLDKLEIKYEKKYLFSD